MSSSSSFLQDSIRKVVDKSSKRVNNCSNSRTSYDFQMIVLDLYTEFCSSVPYTCGLCKRTNAAPKKCLRSYESTSSFVERVPGFGIKQRSNPSVFRRRSSSNTQWLRMLSFICFHLVLFPSNVSTVPSPVAKAGVFGGVPIIDEKGENPCSDIF